MTTLYVSDLDGTLLRNDATLSDYARETLNEAIGRGLLFTVASARSVVSMREVLAGLRLRLPVIEINGAFVSDMETGKHRIVNAFDPSLLREIHAGVERRRIAPMVTTFNGREDCLYYNAVANAGMESYLRNRTEARDPRLRRTPDLRRAFDEQVVSFTLIERRETLAPVVEWLGTAYPDTVRVHFFEDVHAPGWYWATIHDRRASKDQAIRHLDEMCGVGPKETVVFGDNDNDVAMFRAADRSIAVRNATDLLKAHATEIIGSNEEDSVVRYIRDKEETR